MNFSQKTFRLLVLKILLILPLISFGQQSKKIINEDKSNFPTGKKGKVIQKIIDVFNTNDSEKVSQFITKYCSEEFQNMVSIEMHQEEFSYMYNQTGGINFHSIRTYTPDRPDQTKVIVILGI